MKRATFKRWTDFMTQFKATTVERRHYDNLLEHYSGRERYFHTLNHVEYCLKQLDQVMKEALSKYQPLQSAEVEAALWFHDVAYDARAEDNEKKSAEWTDEVLADVGIPPATIQRIHAMILATKHDVVARTYDEKIVSDIDLAVLGDAMSAYKAYKRNLRNEYHWLSDSDFKEYLSDILHEFPKRDEIFQPELFQHKYDAAA